MQSSESPDIYDTYMSSDPTITFFSSTYRRHTTYAINTETIINGDIIRSNINRFEEPTVSQSFIRRTVMENMARPKSENTPVLKSELNKNIKDDCSICMECMIDKEIVSCKKCKKYFDKTCLENWISSGHKTCPLCRHNMFN